MARNDIMEITFLGTGTSHGIPVIGCSCPVCLSENSHNKRMRSSIVINYNNVNVLIDTSPELRMQALTHGIKGIDAVLYTHCHADHVCGFDDLRRFNQLANKAIPCYGKEDALEEIANMFNYVFRETQVGGGKPRVVFKSIDSPFNLFGINVIPIEVFHGKNAIFGYRINNMAYITDCSSISDESRDLLQGLDVLILGALRIRPHKTHFNLDGALNEIEVLKPKESYLTHLCHDMEHDTINEDLPYNVQLAYDGLRLYI